MKVTITVPRCLLSEVDALDAARDAMAGTPEWRSPDEIIQFVNDLRSDDRDPWGSA